MPGLRATAADETATFEQWKAEAERLSGLPVSTVLLSSPAADAIVGFARDDATDLLVMGTHGRGGLRHAVAGSVAEEVVRAAPCPVLVARAGPVADPGALPDEPGMPA